MVQRKNLWSESSNLHFLQAPIALTKAENFYADRHNLPSLLPYLDPTAPSKTLSAQHPCPIPPGDPPEMVIMVA